MPVTSKRSLNRVEPGPDSREDQMTIELFSRIYFVVVAMSYIIICMGFGPANATFSSKRASGQNKPSESYGLQNSSEQ